LFPQIVAAGLVCVQIANVISWSLETQHLKTRASLPAASLGLIDALALLVLLHFEHFRSIRPSTIALLWLFSSLLFDVAQTRTLFLRGGEPQVAIVATLSIALKAVLLVLESIKKTGSLRESTAKPSQEEASGTFARDFFWWLSSLFRQGYGSALKVEDLDNVDVEVSSKPVHTSFIRTWKQCKLP
jgi:ATP-binding cassette, subfamily C (CFTR/MRP), member 1